jgi:hypothetical protein
MNSHGRARSTVMAGHSIVNESQVPVEDDPWNKIIMNNVKEYRMEQELAKQRIKDN